MMLAYQALSAVYPPADPIALQLHYAYKYNGMEEALLASTNAGGENVARGATLGALFGASTGMKGIPPSLIKGLHDHRAIENSIEAFLAKLSTADNGPERAEL
eukprot:SAG31_NODE_343_length_17426_cov_35.294443_19_plen_103_part_00